MTHPDRPGPLDGDVLSAYLAGELDEDAAAALEDRLALDRELARRLDTAARVLGSLRGVDAVEPPPGAGARLRQRLAAEADPPRAAVPTASGAEPTGEATVVTTLASRRWRSWSAVAGIAAGLVAVAVVGGGLIQGFGGGQGVGGGNDQAADTTAQAPADTDANLRQFGESEESARLEADEEAAEDAAEPAPEPAAGPEADQAPAGPVLRDEEVVLADEAAVAARYEGLAPARRLLGESLAATDEHAAAARDALAAAPAFRTGTPPGACLDDLDGRSPAVPVLVESALVDGQAALVYVLVAASPDADTLDRVEVQVRSVPDCRAVLSADVTP